MRRTAHPLADLTAAATIMVSMIALGCRATSPPASSFHRWNWESADFAMDYIAQHDHVVLACIYEDELRAEGPHRSSYRFKGTVVRSYKGDGRTFDAIRFVHGIDSPVSTDFRSNVGGLMFLFTNQHTDAEIGFEPGTFL